MAFRLGGAAQGILVSGSEIGVNPFIALSGEAGDNTPLKGFSARVLPGKTLPDQIGELEISRRSSLLAESDQQRCWQLGL